MNHKLITIRLAVVGMIVAAALVGMLYVDRARAEATLISTSVSQPLEVGEVAYVPMGDYNALALIDIPTHTTIGSIDTAQYGCYYPQRARLNLDGTELYLMCEYSQNIVILDTIDLSYIATINHPGVCQQDVTFVQSGAYALASTSDCHGIYQIDVIDTATHSITQSIDTYPVSIMSIAAHPYLPLAYAAAYQCCYSGSVLVIDTDTFTLQTSIPNGGFMWGVQPSPDGQWVYASDYYYQTGVVKIDPLTNAIVGNLAGMGELFGLQITPDGTKLFVAAGWQNTVYVLDAINFSYITSIYVGGGNVSEMALTCDGSELYVSNSSNSVPVIDTQTYEVTYNISVPGMSSQYGIAICPQYKVQVGTLEGHVTDAETSDPIALAHVFTTPDRYGTTADENGFYHMLMEVGTYSVTAEAYGYFPASAPVEIITDTTVTRDFALEAAPSAIVSGTVTDSLTGWPLYAYITIAGYPSGGVWTDPVTGFYNVSLPEGSSYEFTVSSWVSGYLSSNRLIGPFYSNLTEDFALEADSESCTAPGYQFLPYDQDFEANPSGYTTYGYGWGGVSWEWGSPSPYPGPGSAHSGSKVWATNLGGNYHDGEDSFLESPDIDLTAIDDQPVNFSWWQWLETESFWDTVDIQVSNDGGQNWTTVYGPTSGPVDNQWTRQSVVVDSTFAVFNFRLRFHIYSNDYSNYAGWYLDDVRLGECLPGEGGLVVGNVYDSNLGTPLTGAEVSNDSGESTITSATDDPAVGDSFYTLFSPAETHVFTATYPVYTSLADPIDVILGGTTGHDFYLPAGLLEADPPMLHAEFLLGDTQDVTLNLNNLGEVSAAFELKELDQGFIPANAKQLIPWSTVVTARSDDHEAFPSRQSLPHQVQDADLLLIQDFDPWGLPSIPYLLSNYNIDFDLINSSQISAWDFSPYVMIIIPSVQSWDYYNNFNNNLSKFEQFIDDGGLLMLNYCTQGETIMLPFGGSSVYNPQEYDYLVEPDYPIFTGVPNPIWGTSASHTMLSEALPDDRILMTTGADPGGNPLMIEREHGLGMLVAGGLTYEYGWWFGQDAGLILSNMIPYYYFVWQSTSDVPWLSEEPISGTIAAEGSQPVQVTFDASRLGLPGDYLAELRVDNDTPYGLLNIPVTMTVTPPEDWGQLLGTVISQGYCDQAWDPINEAQVVIQSSTGMSWTLETNAGGQYFWWLDEDGNPYTISVTYTDHQSGQVTDIYVTHENDTIQDFALRWLRACVQETPPALETTLELGMSETLPITLTNTGAAASSFAIEERDGGWVPTSLNTVLVPAYQPSGSGMNAYTDEGLIARDTFTYQLPTGVRLASEDIHVLLVAASDVTQIQALLQAFPDLVVDYYDARNGTPTLAELLEYDNVVLISYYYFYDPVAMGNVLADYIDAGGTVVQTVPTFFGPGGWAISGRFTTEGYAPFIGIGDWFSWANLGDYDPTHPIMEGVSNASDYYRQVMDMAPGAEWVASWTDDEFIATKGNVVALNTALFDGYAWSGDIPLIIHNSITWLIGGGDVPWLSEIPITGTLPADVGVQPVAVTFDSGAISQPGTYYATLNVNNDDPFNSKLPVEITLNAEPTANMGQVSGTVSDAWTGDPLNATVELVGVYTMNADPDYNIWAVEGTYSITAYTADYYTVTLPIEITAGETTVQDIALEPALPRLGELPDEISMSLPEGSSGTQALELANTGPVPLDFAYFEINPLRTLSGTDDLMGKHILYDRAHCQDYYQYNYSILKSDLLGAGATIDENIDPFDESTLEGYNILWLNDGGCTWTYSELQIVETWLSEGGTILIQGENTLATLPPASIFGIIYQAGNCNSGTSTNINPHPITEGVDEFYIEGTCGYITGSPEVIVLDQYMQPHVIAAEQGRGKMVVVADNDFFDWVINNNDNRLLAMNAFQWLAIPSYGDIPWLSETPEQGSLPGHSGLETTLTFDASDLTPGEYDGFLAVEHNDPNQVSPVLIPVQLTVTAEVPPGSVTISGPAAGLVGEGYDFIAVVEPSSTSLPVTYVWEADGQLPITHTGELSDMVSFTWEMTGTQHITVTASNEFGLVSGTYQIVITKPTFTTYLPLAQKAQQGGLEMGQKPDNNGLINGSGVNPAYTPRRK